MEMVITFFSEGFDEPEGAIHVCRQMVLVGWWFGDGGL